MRAAYIERPGPVDEIRVGDQPTPTPGPGQILVRVGAVAFNPIDLYVRSGMVTMPIPLPYTLGTDFAGTVAALGPETSRFRVGDRVWGSNQGLTGRQGAAGEFAAVDEDLAYPTPGNRPDEEAAAQALVGITAHLALFAHGSLNPGATVYIPGGSGGVGSMAVQMARATGARVATSAGGAERAAMCRDLGADLALDYKLDDIPARLREFAPDGCDVWLETRRDPDLETSVPLLALGGRMVVIAGRAAKPVLPLGSLYTRDCSIRGFAMFNATPDAQRAAADAINGWVGAGRLKAPVARTFPLDQAADAQRMMEAAATGGATKAVLRIG